VLPIDDEQLDEQFAELENVDKIIPQNAEKMYYVNLLSDKTAFMSLFAASYASGEKAVTANLPDEYDDFVRQMNAAYTVCVYSRFRKVFASAGLLKLYDFQAIDGLQEKEIRLSQPVGDESDGEQLALAKFSKEQTLKTGNVLKIARNGDYSYYYFAQGGNFKRIADFETLPVDPDKIWEHLKKFKLFSAYAKELPQDIAAGLTETEQQYAKYIIQNQLQAPTETLIKKRVPLSEMIARVLNPDALDEIARRKNGDDGGNLPV
jgi:hypothetical protein